MKTCQDHNYNPPSKCPNCNIHKRRKRKQASQKGWETRRKNQNNEEQQPQKHKAKREEFSIHGWLS